MRAVLPHRSGRSFGTGLALRGNLLSFCLAGPLLALALPAWAAPDAGSLLQQLESAPGAAPGLALPRPPAAPGSAAPASAAVRGEQVVAVTALRVEGNTLVEQEVLARALAGFGGRDLSFAQLQEAVQAVDQAYREAGWLAHVYLPPQSLEQGVVRIHVIEASLGELRFEYPPQSQLPREHIEAMARAQIPVDQPINLRQVDRLLLMLEELPGLMASASYTEGQAPGSSDLLLVFSEGRKSEGRVTADNHGATSTGRSRLSASLSLNNAAGWGDLLQLQAVQTEGSRYLRVNASLPVGLQGWRMGLHASNMRYHLVGDFAALNSSGTSQGWGAHLSIPLQRQADHSMGLLIDGERKRLHNLALASSQSTEAGTVSRYLIDLLRSTLNLSWLDRFMTTAQNSASLQASWGRVDLSGSPNASTDAAAAQTAGVFGKLSANYNREQALGSQASWYLQAGLQWANRNLDSSEKLYLGGAYGVRAYPSNEAGGSSGVTLTTGLRYRLRPDLSLDAFADWGRIQVYRDNQSASGTALTTLNNQALRGLGLGLTWRDVKGVDLHAVWSRRQGSNPGANTSTGKDSDGSYLLNRVWFAATSNF